MSVLFFAALALRPAHVATINVSPEGQIHLPFEATALPGTRLAHARDDSRCSGPLRSIGVLVPMVWFFLAAHRFYRSGWIATVLKTLVLGVLDGLVVAVVVLLTTLVALLGT